VPVPIETLPEVPHEVVPLLKISVPLIPLVPASTVRMTNEPPVPTAPPPDSRETIPPVAPWPEPAVISTLPPMPVVPDCVVDPAKTSSFPPALFVPLPTVINTIPPGPFVAVPVPRDRLPELPQDVVPELKINAPLTPFVPALTAAILIEPLVDAAPEPDSIVIAPPVSVVP
jgi:hypothetical protein